MKNKRKIDNVTQDETKARVTKKLVRDKSNGYDLVNNITIAYIEKENIKEVEKQITRKNFNPKYIDKNGKSITELLNDWKLCESFKFDNSLEPTQTSPDTKNKLNEIIEALATEELNIEFQSINITGHTDTFFDFN